MKSLIIVNPADCIGCRTCEVACVVAHPSEQELNADVFTPAEGTATGLHQCAGDVPSV